MSTEKQNKILYSKKKQKHFKINVWSKNRRHKKTLIDKWELRLVYLFLVKIINKKLKFKNSTLSQ